MRTHSDENPTVASDPLLDRVGKAPRLLRHRLTSPEKRTVKRAQAQRQEYFGAPAEVRPAPDVMRQKLLQLVRDDRGLAEGLEPDDYQTLVTWLLDESMADRTAADVVGLFLRNVGAMERPELSAPRVKEALKQLNDLLYGDDQTGPITRGVREFRLEKRDGGLQVVALLRTTADEGAVARGCRAVLTAANLGDVDVRLVARASSPVG